LSVVGEVLRIAVELRFAVIEYLFPEYVGRTRPSLLEQILDGLVGRVVLLQGGSSRDIVLSVLSLPLRRHPALSHRIARRAELHQPAERLEQSAATAPAVTATAAAAQGDARIRHL